MDLRVISSLSTFANQEGLIVELTELTVQRAQLYLMSSIQDGHAQRDIVELRKKIVEVSKVHILKGMIGKKDGCMLLYDISYILDRIVIGDLTINISTSFNVQSIFSLQ